MTEDSYKEHIKDVEHEAANLYAPGEMPVPPVAWARLKIDMTLMEESDRHKVYEAEQLLRSAGVLFDTGSGGGTRDWELDWSLSGASIEVRPIRCMNQKCSKVGFSYCFWAIVSYHKRCYYKAYCTMQCREVDIAATPDNKVILLCESLIWNGLLQ